LHQFPDQLPDDRQRRRFGSARKRHDPEARLLSQGGLQQQFHQIRGRCVTNSCGSGKSIARIVSGLAPAVDFAFGGLQTRKRALKGAELLASSAD